MSLAGKTVGFLLLVFVAVPALIVLAWPWIMAPSAPLPAALPGSPDIPRLASGEAIEVPAEGLVARWIPATYDDWKLLLTVQDVQGPGHSVVLMTPAAYRSFQAKWGRETLFEYNYMGNYEMKELDPRRKEYRWTRPLAKGDYVAVLRGGGAPSKVRLYWRFVP